jgi:MFS family permease
LWSAWTLGALFFFLAFVLRVSPSVMVDELMRDFAVGAGLVGHLSAFYFYAYAGFQIPVGLLMGRFGARRLMASALGACALGCLIFSAAEMLGMAYLGRLLIGLGCAFSFVGGLTIAATWLPARHFALLAGLVQAFGMMGAMSGQAPLAWSVAEIGWRATMALGAGACLALGLAAWFVVPERPAQADDGGLRQLGRQLAAALRRPPVLLAALFGGAMSAPMLAFAALWGVPYLVQVHGLERPLAAAITSLLFLGWGVGAPVMGALSDWDGRRKRVALGGAMIALVTLSAALYLPGLPIWALGALLLVHGLGASGMVVAFALAREAVAPPVGSVALGIVNTVVVASGALFQPLVGIALDLMWDGRMSGGVPVYDARAYGWALATLPIYILVGAIAIACAREGREDAGT